MLRYVVFFLFILLLIPTDAMVKGPLHVVSMVAPPMVMVKDGQITGMAADLAREGLKRAGYDYVIQLVPWKRAVNMVKAGSADALFYPIYTDERAGFFYYPATPLFSIDLVALKRADSDIVIRPGYEGLHTAVLGVGRGFKYGPKAQELLEKAHFKRVEETATNELGFRKLLAGRIDLMLMDRTLARHFLDLPETFGQADFVRDEQGRLLILDSKNGYMVFSRKTSSSVDADKFDRALESMKQDGSYQIIIDRYQ